MLALCGFKWTIAIISSSNKAILSITLPLAPLRAPYFERSLGSNTNYTSAEPPWPINLGLGTTLVLLLFNRLLFGLQRFLLPSVLFHQTVLVNVLPVSFGLPVFVNLGLS